MKKHKFLLIGVLFLSLLLALSIYLFRIRKSASDTFTPNTPEIDKLVNITQAEVSAFVFVTQESIDNYRLHVNFTPFLSFDVGEKKIKSFVLRNFKKESKVGDLLLIHPTQLSIETPSRTFLFTPTGKAMLADDIYSEGNTIAYEVVEEVSKYNEILDKGVLTPYFGVIQKDIGTVNYAEIKEEEETFDSSKYIEYAQMSYGDLNSDFSFEVVIEFSDGTVYMKRFILTIEGEIFAEETSPLFNFQLE